MNAWRVARIGSRALTLGVVTVSGVYLIVYLYRWEWNRALISGLFFLAALVTFSTSLVLSSLRALDHRVDQLEGAVRATASARPATSTSTAADADGTRQFIQRANDEQLRQRFDWLREPPQGFGVFVPVLIGTGVLLSGVTYLIERLAGAFASRTVDHRTARLLAPDLPLGGRPLELTAVNVATAASFGSASHRDPEHMPAASRTGHLLGWFIVLAIGTLLTVAAVNTIADATQSRGDDSASGGSTTIDLRISQRRAERPPEVVAQALWTACQNTVGVEITLVAVDATGTDHVRLTLDAGLGDLARRRLFGCLEDATLDLVRADVVGHAVGGG
jgi:hypothetical protein